MNEFIDDLERELRAAASRRVRLATASVPRPPAAAAVTGVTALVCAAVVAFALQLSPAKHRPPSPPPPTGSAPLLPAHPTRRQIQEENYLYRALSTASRSDEACAPGPPRHGSTITQGSPSPALLSILGVLRRPARPSDKLPVRITYHPYRRDPNGSLPALQGIYVHDIRRARWRYGAGYYLVPAANANPRAPLPARCYVEQRAALQRELPRIPARLRAGTLALEPRFLAQLRASSAPYPGVCLAALNDTGNGDGCGGGASVSAIEQGHSLASGGPTGVGVVYGIVPDGVATVTLYYSGRHHGRPRTARAISNVFILHNPRQRLPHDGFPTKIVWRAADERIIKTISY